MTIDVETHTIQTWPSGRMYEYQGDPNGPPEQRRLRAVRCMQTGRRRWRKGNAGEWRGIVINRRAEMYQDRDVLCCDSMVVSALIEAGGSGELDNTLGEGFSADEIRNLYPDPVEWDAERCKEWLEEHGHEVPSATRHTSCTHCESDIEGQIGGQEWQDRGSAQFCRTSGSAPDAPKGQRHAPTDAEQDEEEYLGELREAVRDNAEPAEVMEWWRVSSWLCEQLHAIGEVTIDNNYGCWWGRQATGQGYLMDGTLQRVAAQFD